MNELTTVVVRERKNEWGSKCVIRRIIFLMNEKMIDRRNELMIIEWIYMNC